LNETGPHRISAPGRAAARLLPLLMLAASPTVSRAQVPVEPVLAGRVLIGDTVMTSGFVLLHHVSQVAEGVLDSVQVAPDGSFVVRLPQMPDEGLGEIYFATVQHDGVLYPGREIMRPIDLDSLYVIHAYDTLIVPPEGVPVGIEQRSVFFEQNDAAWAATDVFQLRNDTDRTLLPRESGNVWRYPLPAGARDVSAIQEMSANVVGYEGADLVFRGAIPPGPRLLVVRYFLDSLAVTIPTPGITGAMDVLVREPSPSFDVEGLTQVQPIQLEGGASYRVFSAENLTLPQVRLTLVEEEAPPPVQWIAVVLAMVLAGGGVLALRGRSTADAASKRAPAGEGRQAILLEIARLDDEYEALASPSAGRTKEYRRRRAELLKRLRSQA